MHGGMKRVLRKDTTGKIAVGATLCFEKLATILFDLFLVHRVRSSACMISPHFLSHNNSSYPGLKHARLHTLLCVTLGFPSA